MLYRLLITLVCVMFPLSVPAEDISWEKDGETLYYDVYWAFIKAGEATLQYTPKERRQYEVKSHAWTTSGVKSLFTLKDTIKVEGKHTLKHGFLPELYTLNLSENDYRADKNVKYNHANKEAIYTNVWGKQEPRSYSVEANTRDMISALYFLRATEKDPKPGDSFSLPVFDLDRPYLMTLNVLARETVEVGDYKVQTIHIQPILKGVKEDKISDKWHFWVTDDGSFTPVKILVDMRVGSFKAELKSRRVGKRNVAFGRTPIHKPYDPASGF